MSKENGINVDNLLIEKLKNRVINRELKPDFERTDIMQEVYKEYEGYPQIIIRARFLERLLENKKIYIDENLFVGSLAGETGAFYIYPEWDTSWLNEKDGFKIPEEKEESLLKLLDYWKGKTLPERAKNKYKDIFKEDIDKYIESGFIQDVNLSPVGVSASDYEKVIKVGLEALINEVEEKRNSLAIRRENKDKLDFYEAVLIVFKATIKYANRYAALAEKLAEEEVDENKKQELLELAKVCRQVPQKPARTFREALQSHFFLHIISQLEQVGCGYSHGFLGQSLEPYYLKDIKDGNLTKDEAIYLLKHHFLKLNDINYYYGNDYELVESGDTAQTINIGGYDENGNDATGEVDYLILDAQLDLRLPQPPLALIYHNKLKPDFVKKAIELVKTGIGMPQFMNADVLVARSLDAYSRYGATLQEARRSCVFGCVSTAIPNKTAYLQGDAVNLAKAFELALYNGMDPTTNLKVGPETGEPNELDSFDKFYSAFKLQLDNGIKKARLHGQISNMLYGEFLPVAFRSAITDGCLESGRDLWNDGAKYTSTMTVYCGGVDAANSLLAVKELVYDKKAITLDELKAALSADFNGYEVIKQLCLNIPKHGNNVDKDEELVQRVYRDAFEGFQKVGGNYFDKYGKPDAYSKSIHNYFGLLTGALPTGRNAGKALTDGSVSAQPGTDKNGPTALVISAARAMDTTAYNSVHLNVKVNPEQLKSPLGNNALLALIDGFMKQGGNHIQFNCVDAKILKDAKIHPENHKDLVVRVAGFSAFFTRLHEGIQDEIIARTEHSLAV